MDKKINHWILILLLRNYHVSKWFYSSNITRTLQRYHHVVENVVNATKCWIKSRLMIIKKRSPFDSIIVSIYDMEVIMEVHCDVSGFFAIHTAPVISQKSAKSALAPVPLSIFRSNSKFDENSERSSFKYIRPITTIFCTRHDSDTVVTCAKYRCDRPRIFYTRVFWIFIEFRIRSKYA